MSKFPLNDEQRLAATTLHGPLLITAGAGSGKTRVLTERTANAVIDGQVSGWEAVGIDEVLAITFTDKAAGELAERVRHALRAAGHGDLARRVDSAWISTIHGMCARILRAESLEIGLDPEFRVLDGVESGHLRVKALEAVLRDALEEDEAARSLVNTFSVDAIAKAVKALSAFMRTHRLNGSDVRVDAGRQVRGLISEVVRFHRQAGVDICACQGDPEATDRNRQACVETADALAEVLKTGAGDIDMAHEALRVLEEHTVDGSGKGLTNRLREIKSERTGFCADLETVVTAPMAEELVRLAGRFTEAFTDLKHAAGGLDFDDLEFETRDLLERPEMARKWGERFKLTLVDEFQDTNEIQLAIVRALGGENLCTVGDEHQSIYRFRGADVGVFARHAEQMRDQSAVEAELRCNYRSHPEILGFVNAVFGTAAMFDGRLTHLEAARVEPEPAVVRAGVPRVTALVVSPVTSSHQCRQTLAAEVAERFRTLHEDEGVPLSDMVVLVRAYTHAEQYAAAMRDRGLDCVVLGGNRFFEVSEVQAARAALRFLANHSDDAAFLQLAASDLCGISDSGLLAITEGVREHGGAWASSAHATLSDDDTMRLRLLESAIESALACDSARTVGETLLRFLEGLGVDLRLVAGGTQGAQSYAALLKLARMADLFESTQGGGIPGFIEYLDDRERFGEHEAPASLVGDGSQTVRVMSIHSSKGLEFPVVAVVELESPGGSGSDFARWELDGAARLAVKRPGGNKDAVPAVYREIADNAKSADSEEVKRLFYVACTRAKDVLILSGFRGATSTATTMLNMLVDAAGIPLGGDAETTLALENGTPLAVKTFASSVEEAEEAAGPEAGDGRASARREPSDPSWFEAAAAPVTVPPTPQVPPRRLSYSAIHSYSECGLSFDARRRLGVGSGLTDDTPAVRFGSAVHAALESVGESGELTRERATALVRFFELESSEASRLLEVVRRYQGSDLAAEMCAHATVRREAPLSVWLGGEGPGFVLDGSIDAYGRTGDRALIVDFKSGTSDATEEELDARYRLQARCYALAAMRDGAREVDAVFVRPEVERDGEIQQVRLRFTAEEAGEIEAQLMAAWSAMAAGEYAPLAQWDDTICGRCPVPPAMCAVKAAKTGR